MNYAAWFSLKRNKPAQLGMLVIGLLVIMALAGPAVSGYSYAEQDLESTNLGPDRDHWFGTDSLGRDLFTRVCYGARISLAVGVFVCIISGFIGIIYGGCAGYAGGRIDDAMMRFVDIFSSVPFILYVILLMVVIEPGMITVFVVLGITGWMNMARIVRAQVLSLKEREFVLAARSIGAGAGRVLFRHIIPNIVGPVMVTMIFVIPEAIFAEAFLSFLGLGVSIPQASLGTLVSEGIGTMGLYPWQLFFPAFFISLSIMAFYFWGNGLRDALDPRVQSGMILDVR
ncbi:ABC transporter permease [Phosphitispora sp. TUW77]|uniref:ABC transporter permease n=1 Tax=Phosphitispora sp. TUW77 TaxID=3152361 RepID=UPI003AB235D3